MPTIEHVVVLALENRSFDHKLGFLKQEIPDLEGLTGEEGNLADPSDGSPRRFLVTPDAPYVGNLDHDPGHDLPDVAMQLFGRAGPVDYAAPPDNSGFYLSYNLRSPGHGAEVLRCFAPGALPVFHTLAREFAVCDQWFSSCPGPTWPNRFFLHCASAGGYMDGKLRRYSMPTIFEKLAEHRKSFGIYFHDYAFSLMLSRLRPFFFGGHFHPFRRFIEHAAQGRLPSYSFLEPRYFNHGSLHANDEHPPHDVRFGEHLIADVYEAVRASPAWESTLLVILSDEHGGFFDHCPPPLTAPLASHTKGFDFNRLGVRVPVLLISPLIPRQSVDKTRYDHSSIPATLRRLFGLSSPVAQRDATANTFEHIVSLAGARDTPSKVQRPLMGPLAPAPNQALTPLQRSMLVSAASLKAGTGQRPPSVDRIKREHAGAAFIEKQMARFIEPR